VDKHACKKALHKQTCGTSRNTKKNQGFASSIKVKADAEVWIIKNIVAYLTSNPDAKKLIQNCPNDN